MSCWSSHNWLANNWLSIMYSDPGIKGHFWISRRTQKFLHQILFTRDTHVHGCNVRYNVTSPKRINNYFHHLAYWQSSHHAGPLVGWIRWVCLLGRLLLSVCVLWTLLLNAIFVYAATTLLSSTVIFTADLHYEAERVCLCWVMSGDRTFTQCMCLTAFL